LYDNKINKIIIIFIILIIQLSISDFYNFIVSRFYLSWRWFFNWKMVKFKKI